MRTNIIKHSAIVFIALFFSCSKDDTPETYPKDIAFTEYSLEGTNAEWSDQRSLLGIPAGTLSYLANSDEQMDVLVDGDYPPIDFSKKTLFVADGSTSRNIGRVNISVKQLTEDYFRMFVDLVFDDTAESDDWRAAVVIDKLLATAKIDVTLTDMMETRASVTYQANPNNPYSLSVVQRALIAAGGASAQTLRATAYSDWSNFKNGPVYEPDSYMNPLRKKEEEI